MLCRGGVVIVVLLMLLPACILGRETPHDMAVTATGEHQRATSEQMHESLRHWLRAEKSKKESAALEGRDLLVFNRDYSDPTHNTNPGISPSPPPPKA